MLTETVEPAGAVPVTVGMFVLVTLSPLTPVSLLLESAKTGCMLGTAGVPPALTPTAAAVAAAVALTPSPPDKGAANTPTAAPLAPVS